MWVVVHGEEVAWSCASSFPAARIDERESSLASFPPISQIREKNGAPGVDDKEAVNDIIRARTNAEMKRAMRLIGAVALVVCWLAGLAELGAQGAASQSKWAQPAADLAGQVADILGPSQAQFTIRNLSTIQSSEIPAIRKSLEQNLKAHGVVAGGTESANAIRVTLSENARERLWVAEVAQGNETRVAMVRVDAPTASALIAGTRIALRRERVQGLLDRNGIAESGPILSAAEIAGRFVVMFDDRISIYSPGARGWTESSSFPIDRKMTRDPRGIVLANADGNGFTAFAPGAECAGSYSIAAPGTNPESGWTVHCRASDDPWAVYQTSGAIGSPAVKAFYNTARDYFTGVVTPNVGADLPAFYAAGIIPRAVGGAALLVTGIGGRVQMIENGTLRTVAGTRDWGSDFAVVRSGCGTGAQVIVSGSGEAANDSLRAFEIPASEALPASGPLTMEGTVTALWPAPDGKSAFAVVRNAANQYEVDRVSALCN